MKLLPFLFFLLLVTALQAQTPVAQTQAWAAQGSTLGAIPGCATDVLRNIKQQQPAYARLLQQMDSTLLHNLSGGNSRATLNIPVVVHVIHNNGPENISTTQVTNAIQHLNDAFANAGAYAQPNGINTGIQFCLAKQDPNGVYTTGITYTVSPLTNVIAETQDADLKNLIRWDPTRYLNIWVVAEISSLSVGPAVAGYAYFPSSHGQPEDGIVCEAAYFGSNTDNSKVLIHEAGHYLGLYHTFEGGCGNANCLTNGDRVCDTPPDNSTAAVACGASPNTCTSDDDDLSANNPFRPIANGGLGDQPDMFTNYMDYGLQICQNRLTQGQSDRMNTALTTVRASLLQSAGCNSICFSLINTNFTASNTSIIIGGTVTFTVTPATPGATYTWTKNGVNIGSGTSINHTFNSTGNYAITLTGSNNQPACTDTQTIIIHVDCNAQASFTLSPNGPYNVGATITATSTSTNATSYAWYLDGLYQGNGSSFSRQFNSSGGHNVSLIVSSNLCSDTSATAFFDVGNCTLSGMNANWVIAYKRLYFSPPNIGTGGSPMSNFPQESVSTLSDPDGNMLFTTDGLTVWNSFFDVMPNGSGLLGHYSSTQGSLASPYPGSSNLYYIFTTDGAENNGVNGCRYSIVDMSLEGGLGDVVASKKNILLRDSVCEKLTGTFHANGRDIWITIAGRNSKKYYSYLLSPAGINTVPVVSTMGSINNDILGGMKFSHDGNKAAACVVSGSNRALVIANFNKLTGQFFGDFSISYPSILQPYSVEFSPDNSKLYISFWNRNYVYQYNLAAGSNAAIIASETRVDIYGTTPPVVGQLALANNGKIYVYSAMSNALDVINSPNLAGSACNYTQGTIAFQTLQGAIGLQNIITGLDQPHNPEIAGPAKLCLGGTQHQYTIPYATNNDVAVWTYTGPGTLVTNGITATITSGNTTGSGYLSVMLTGSCGVGYDTLAITTVQPDAVFIGNDTAFCNLLNLHAQHPFASYQWSTGSSNDTISVSTGGTYWLQAFDANGCASSDTITLVTNPPINPVTITTTGSLCTYGVVVLNAGTGYNDYQWQDGFPEQSYTAFLPGTYWVTVRNGCNTAVDSIVITANTGGHINFNLQYNGDTLLCDNILPITIVAPAGYSSYLWQDNSTNDSLLITAPGVYWVSVADSCGSGSDTLTVTNGVGFELTLNDDSIACKTALPFVLNGPPGYTQYLWFNGTTGQSVNINSIGNFWLQVTDAGGCTGIDTFQVLDCVGLTETLLTPVKIYPNPANEQLRIELNGAAVVTLFNVAGQRVLYEQISGNAVFNTAPLAQGIYVVEILTPQRIWRHKLWVSH